MDYQYLCQSFFSLAHLPVNLSISGKSTDSFGISSIDFVYENLLAGINKQTSFPAIIEKNYGSYIIFCPQEQIDIKIIIGPLFQVSLEEKSIKQFYREESIISESTEELSSELLLIPVVPYNRILYITTFFEYILNNHKMDFKKDFMFSDDSSVKSVSISQTHNAYQKRDENYVHGTYQFEQQILDLIKTGNRGKLEQLLLSFSLSSIQNEGSVATTALRQAKNVFIAQTALMGKCAAIPGGADTELIYQLIDQYSQECERMQTVEQITILQFQMLLDFASRVADAQIPAGVSSEIYHCIQYINSHVNEPISLDNLADEIGKSKSYTIKHFKDELGFNPGVYITHARIQEAKSLLRFTDKSLSEISSYLCFSSQSYFQNIFKKITGITPTEYRKARREA